MIIYAVDDERPALTLLKSAIRKAIPESDPICFSKPSELLDRAMKQVPDICFMDIEMPGMTGLELAKKLNELNENIHIIFVTGYGQYAMDAFDVYASGYIMKPCTAAQIEKVMSKILPVNPYKDIIVRTFGNFDVLYKGKSIVFRSQKSKEMLAYLVDRNGSFVSRQEMAGILFEDDFSRGVQSRLSQFATKLSEDLDAVGIRNFFFSDNGYSLDLTIADCDLVDFLLGKTSLYTGEYMEQYSWGEYRKSEFDNLK